MADPTVLLSRLDRVKQRGANSWSARCPAHDDRDPSLSIAYRADTGQVLLHCFSGCVAEDVLAAVGLTFADVMPEQRPGERVPPDRVRQRHFRIRRYVENFVEITANMVNREGYRPTDKDIAQLEIFASFLRGEIRSTTELRERIEAVGGRLPA